MKRRADEESGEVPVMGVPGGIDVAMYQAPEAPVGGIDSNSGTAPSPVQGEAIDKPPNYRTRRCMRWAQGNCHLGDSCTFLHSGFLHCVSLSTAHPYMRNFCCPR